jgi:hypothetical protein
MNFSEVVDALKIIRTYCRGKSNCKHCRLHAKEDVKTCGVAVKGASPATWEFDLDPEENIPSIFK